MIVELTKKHFSQISQFIKENFDQWLIERNILPHQKNNIPDSYLERMIRIEEEIKYMRQDMQGFRDEMKEMRLEMRHEMKEMRNETNQRFDAATKRMDRFMIWSFGITVTVAGICTGIILQFH